MDPGRQRRECTFQLLRYVPDAVRNEYVHIGVILREEGEGGRMDVRLTRDWRRVRCLDPEADTALLEGMESELRRMLADREGRFRKILEESLSLSVQMTEPKAYLAESLPAGMEELMRMYVEPPPREKVSRLRGRAAIQAGMRREFEQAGVWDLLRKQIRAADYTRPGDPLRIDMGYRMNGGDGAKGETQGHAEGSGLSAGAASAGAASAGAAFEGAGLIRMFQAVSLEPGVEMAKVLAFSAAGLRAGVERLERAGLELTAIIEPAAKIAGEDEPERLEMYRFGVETMEEHRIRVLTTADMPRVAAAARRELVRG